MVSHCKATVGLVCLISVLFCRRNNNVNRQDFQLKVSRSVSTEIRTNSQGVVSSKRKVENHGDEENQEDNAYADSEVTSVYSCNGSMIMDDQSYSVASSLMCPSAAYGEEAYDANKSRSVIDGLEPPEWRQAQETPDAPSSPSRMVVTTKTQEMSNSSDAILRIFSDDDDEASLLSSVSDRVVGPVALTYGYYGPPMEHHPTAPLSPMPLELCE